MLRQYAMTGSDSAHQCRAKRSLPFSPWARPAEGEGIEHSLRGAHIRSLKALGEAVVDRREDLSRLVGSASVCPQTGKACRSA